MTSGKRVKMVIEAYEKPDFTSSAGEYSLQINPEKYEKKAVPATSECNRLLSNGESVANNKPADVIMLVVNFMIDSTGLIEGCEDVQENINALKKLCTEINGNIHRPNYLKVRWGDSFVFPCVMKDLKVDFSLFKPDGSPVRAKIEAVFEEFIDAGTKAKKANNSSPDLTHVKTVVEGDNLPMLCYKVYGDPKYYIQVAEFNKLVAFNNLKPNQRIIFPPLSHD